MIPIRVVPALLVLAATAGAQSSGVVDEASFTVTRDGAAYGTESFKIIRRLGAEGVEYVAQCTRTMDGRIVKTSLTTDSTGSATSYSRMTTGGVAGQLTARRALNRLTVSEDGTQGSTRDYVFPPGSVILDEDVIHQFYFVTRREPRSLGFVAPGGRAAAQGALTEVGRENLVIGGTVVPATRFAFGAGDARREIWVDSGKRLLKVAWPAQRTEGTRDLPPR
ncbi:MAG TPA: hypothetical protein VFO55_03025 [Gemmatimonadaceae bacterium]|nr:hypothetical protein [Gemmatimonadaceae bacterium]